MKAGFPSGSLPEGLQERIDNADRERPFSIFWEVRTLLYLGVVSLSSGLGILIYKNIDTIGHQTILALIAALTAACFWYCAKRARPFTTGPTAKESSWSDYVLLLGVLLFGIFTGYLQAQYTVFGTHYGLALSIPALLYLFLAYRFDHRGVLQLGLSGLCAAVGVVVTPLSAVDGNLFDHRTPVYAGLGMGVLFAAAGILSEKIDFKSHFNFSYVNFAMHLGLIASLTGMMTGGGFEEWMFFLLLAALTAGLWTYARRRKSHYFLLCAVLYGYIAFTYMVMHHLFQSSTMDSMSLLFLYFILSCGGTIYFFLNVKTFLGIPDAGVSEK